MLSDIIFSLNRVAPYFLLIVLGAVLRRSGLVSRGFFSGANRFTFRIALPFQLFCSITGIERVSGTTGRFMLFLSAATLVSFAAVWAVTEVVYRKDKVIIGTLVQGGFRSNFVLLGVPLAGAVLGPGAERAAALASIVLIPAFNGLSVLVLSVRGSDANRQSVAGVLRGVVTNPLIIGIFFAIPVWLLGIRIPEAVNTTFNYVGATATPLGLLSIGGMLNLSDATKRLRPAVYATAIKNFILPAAVMLASCRFGLRNEELLVMLVTSATPVAVGSYAMAGEMGGDAALASNIVILSTFISGFVLSLGIYILKTHALI